MPSGPVHSSADGAALVRIVADRLDRGVLLLDRRGAILYANGLALGVVRDGDGIAVRGGRLSFSDASLDQRLAALLDHDGGGAGVPAAGFGVRVRRSSVPPFRVVVTPVVEHVDGLQVAFVVLIFAADGRRAISSLVLKEIYQLTRAQTDVASRLYEGLSVEQTAAALGLSLNTVRSHLKQIFTKCEVQSQAELMQLLALGPLSF